MVDEASAKEATQAEEPSIQPLQEPRGIPASTAIGNDKIAVLSHHLPDIRMEQNEEFPTARIDLVIRNVSDSTIATAVFEAVFYDREGNIVDTVRHSQLDLPQDTSRLVHIASVIPVYEYDGIQSYTVRIVRMTTTDFERVQFQRYELTPLESGEEEISGIVKNISGVQTDVAIIATFYDPQKETIGNKVLVLRDLEPQKIRKFEFRFKPQKGDTVRGVSLALGEVME